ncbi:3-hydroxybutyryl-CoA dehydrogenase [Sporobacter termitidis DSM 10068]|uniref:L-gulonate 3-dehydrogenase n=1 Tax=Sporobacter termitidis DSM 10068 TaxID=1123282 RepID=A0A1M5YY85_9FIRM|nr:3-hydroxyacyl-CoA dehydrogenase family protein [Sporobacter termitidis]SHI17022.1 3-hydroxybutyryl-CoA dehydrogenase [Sporobacter termitidis DSM 10068]
MKLDNVKHIGIIGLGMIGDSMAVLTTGHGYRTTCVARRAEMIPEYQKTYDMYFRQMIDQGLMPEKQLDICKKYVKYTLDYNELADCDVIFECVTENIGLKHDIYAKLENICTNLKVICSVSSSFVPDVLAEKATKFKDRIIVTHPFNPAHMVPFFELCGGAATDPAALQFAKQVLESLDRKPVILKKPAPGFIGNRLQFALWREALNLVESGICEPRDVDTCLNYSFCPRYTSIGIFEHFDNGDLRLNITTCNTVFPTLSNISEAPPAITDRIARGDTGARADSHKGFYDWNGVDMPAYRERVNAPYWKFIDWDMPKE